MKQKTGDEPKFVKAFVSVRGGGANRNTLRKGNIHTKLQNSLPLYRIIIICKNNTISK